MIYSKLLRPLFFKADPEWIHHLSIQAMCRTPLPWFLTLGQSAPSDPLELFGLRFRNRIGLAAGFDKNADLIAPMHQLGFGFTELGTITQHAQPGNPQPRIFRCPLEYGLVNRMGFPNAGAEALAIKIQAVRSKQSWEDYPIGINIGKSKITDLDQAANDYASSFRTLFSVADFFVINVSSPNTPGLRTLQSRDALAPILNAVQKINRELGAKPLLLKIAPDLSEPEIADILQLISDYALSGIVASNTTLDHSTISLKETGGLSGLPVREKSTKVIRFIHQETQGKMPIIGVGGVFTRADYLEKLEAGASLVQVYTGFVYQGPWIVHQLLKSN
ncbi:MAG: quinone-dependent dihydroorotate dehydrogenase [Blastochloris sp.]|nr:quinone-dependent dihydroorotate dehydrogenase [Blastochloris sp.]